MSVFLPNENAPVANSLLTGKITGNFITRSTRSTQKRFKFIGLAARRAVKQGIFNRRNERPSGQCDDVRDHAERAGHL